MLDDNLWQKLGIESKSKPIGNKVRSLVASIHGVASIPDNDHTFSSGKLIVELFTQAEKMRSNICGSQNRLLNR